MADAAGLGPVGGDTVGVQIPSPAHSLMTLRSWLSPSAWRQVGVRAFAGGVGSCGLAGGIRSLLVRFAVRLGLRAWGRSAPGELFLLGRLAGGRRRHCGGWYRP